MYDCTLSMGLKSSARCCQKVTSMVVYIFNNYDFFAINYLDDLGGCEEESRAETAYQQLREILLKMGLKEAVEKSVAPTTVMVFLGIEVNTVTFTLRIPADKWLEIKGLLRSWRNKTVANLKETQQLAGSLNFACRCIKSRRIYLSRILNYL